MPRQQRPARESSQQRKHTDLPSNSLEGKPCKQKLSSTSLFRSGQGEWLATHSNLSARLTNPDRNLPILLLPDTDTLRQPAANFSTLPPRYQQQQHHHHSQHQHQHQHDYSTSTLLTPPTTTTTTTMPPRRRQQTTAPPPLPLRPSHNNSTAHLQTVVADLQTLDAELTRKATTLQQKEHRLNEIESLLQEWELDLEERAARLETREAALGER